VNELMMMKLRGSKIKEVIAGTKLIKRGDIYAHNRLLVAFEYNRKQWRSPHRIQIVDPHARTNFVSRPGLLAYSSCRFALAIGVGIGRQYFFTTSHARISETIKISAKLIHCVTSNSAWPVFRS
jgi:hypothetical protein